MNSIKYFIIFIKILGLNIFLYLFKGEKTTEVCDNHFGFNNKKYYKLFEIGHANCLKNRDLRIRSLRIRA